MNNIEILIKEMNVFTRNQKLKNSNVVKSRNHLHSGELSVVDFIDKYEKETNEPPTLSTISKSLSLSQATVTVIVNRLIDKNLLEKTPSEANKSRKLVSLTKEGITQLERRRAIDIDRFTAISEYLGEEDTEKLTKIISKINEFYKNGTKSTSN